VTSKTREQLNSALGKGSPVTIEAMRAPREESYRIIDIRDGQLGVTYKQLFGAYLAGREAGPDRGPYVRMAHQVANIEKLLQLVEKPEGCTVHLVTMFEKNDRYGLSEEQRSRTRLDDLQARLKYRGWTFSYEFDPKQHDRFLKTEHWQIILGRGLDFLYPPDRQLPSGASAKARGCKIIAIRKR
jgi:Phospholipase D-like domain at C-terminus of MIT